MKTPAAIPAAVANFTPDRLRLSALRGAFAAAPADAAPDAPARVDAEAGVIRGVALITGDREASGHGCYVDGKTVSLFSELLAGRKLKAYATHDNCGLDGTLDEVGYWADARMDGGTLRADFHALDAWRKYSPGEYATLFELAEKLPDEFGASLSFRMSLAWVGKDGAEFATQRELQWTDDGPRMAYAPAAPADAVRNIPSVRPSEVYSADFVNVPAANDGLFCAALPAAAPAPAPVTAPVPPAAPAENFAAQICAENRVREIAILGLHFSADISTTQIHKPDTSMNRLKNLQEIRGSKLKELEQLSASALDADGKARLFTADESASFEAKKVEVLAFDAEIKKECDLIALAAVVPVTAAAPVAPGAAVTPAKKELTLAEFNALTPFQKSEHCRAGGTVAVAL